MVQAIDDDGLGDEFRVLDGSPDRSDITAVWAHTEGFSAHLRRLLGNLQGY